MKKLTLKPPYLKIEKGSWDGFRRLEQIVLIHPSSLILHPLPNTLLASLLGGAGKPKGGK
jgi:hypothetical protein